ncbi:MAG: M28 family peptidase [Candidatus Riflebacteria bacterium]|nr:M28 family peptidase [Candidatus Riflebacteria bacterium]
MRVKSFLPFFVVMFSMFVSVVSAQAIRVSDRQVFIVPTIEARDILNSDSLSCESWTAIGETMLVIGGEGWMKTLDKKKVAYKTHPIGKTDEIWLLTTKDPSLKNIEFAGARQIFRANGFAVFMGDEITKMGFTSKYSSDFSRVDPLPGNEELLSMPRYPLKTTRNDATGELLDRLNREAFTTDLKVFLDCKTRYTYTEGAMQALAYAEKVMTDLGLAVKRLPFGSSGQKRENLEGFQAGSDASNAGEVIVIGHLDSTSEQAKTFAPGADDNGSGSAGVLALARLMKGLKPRANVRFVLVLGEEQAILGSKAFAAALKPEEVARIRCVINMDMIGFDAKQPLSMQIETSKSFTQTARQFADLAAKYTTMTTVTSYNPWGSDHVPFIKKEIPAVLTIESEFDDNPTYHKTTDVFEKVNLDLCHQILRLNAAVLAETAGVEKLSER